MVIYNGSDFGNSESVGGATGSVKAQHQTSKWYGQLKPSIKSKGFFNLRRRKVGGLDVENFAELIGAKVAYSVMGEEEKHLVPEVSFLVDKETKQVGVVSRYLANVKGPLLEDKDTQLVVTDNPSTKKDHEINETEKKGVCKAIALSILVGDHDINPGNMLKISDDKIARIDYGHAFNDLLSAPSIFGGQVRNKENQVLDFFNREKVNTAKLNDSTKLWRSYENLIPSEEMAQALEDLANSSKETIGVGIASAKKDFEDLLTVDGVDKKHILKSLAAIANNLEGKKISVNTQNPQETIDAAFKKIKAFSLQQGESMERTAKLMRFQLMIDKKIEAKQPITEAEIKAFNEIATKESGLGDGKGKINWIKTSKDKPAFTGSVRDYVKKFGAERKLSAAEISNLLPSPPQSKLDIFLNGIKEFFIRGKDITAPSQTASNTYLEVPKQDLESKERVSENEINRAENEGMVMKIKIAFSKNQKPPINKNAPYRQGKNNDGRGIG